MVTSRIWSVGAIFQWWREISPGRPCYSYLMKTLGPVMFENGDWVGGQRPEILSAGLLMGLSACHLPAPGGVTVSPTDWNWKHSDDILSAAWSRHRHHGQGDDNIISDNGILHCDNRGPGWQMPSWPGSGESSWLRGLCLYSWFPPRPQMGQSCQVTWRRDVSDNNDAIMTIIVRRNLRRMRRQQRMLSWIHGQRLTTMRALTSPDTSVHMSVSRFCPDLQISLVCPDVQSPMSICPL